MGEAVVRVRAVVHGRVQMVGFRAFVIRHAENAGLSGTVRNEPDGSVETVLEGPRPEVERVLELLRRGPTHARVERVEVEYSNPTGSLPAMMVAS
jgi:acylphosphatase